MNVVFTTKKGDTGRPFKIRLYDGLVDLTGWAATLTMFKKHSSENKIDEKPMTLLDQADSAKRGWFEYYPTVGEVDTAGEYLVEIDVTRPDGLKITLPAESDEKSVLEYFTAKILPSRNV